MEKHKTLIISIFCAIFVVVIGVTALYLEDLNCCNCCLPQNRCCQCPNEEYKEVVQDYAFEKYGFEKVNCEGMYQIVCEEYKEEHNIEFECFEV